MWLNKNVENIVISAPATNWNWCKAEIEISVNVIRADDLNDLTTQAVWVCVSVHVCVCVSVEIWLKCVSPWRSGDCGLKGSQHVGTSVAFYTHDCILNWQHKYTSVDRQQRLQKRQGNIFSAYFRFDWNICALPESMQCFIFSHFFRSSYRFYLAAEQYLCSTLREKSTKVNHGPKLVNWLGKLKKLRSISVFGQRVLCANSIINSNIN